MQTKDTQRQSVLRYLQAVGWSFLGIRRGAQAREDMSRLRLLPLVLTGLVLAAAFVGLLLLVANLAAHGGPA